jgi:RNA polymerase sigma-70 factor, ECF subfamily
MACLEKPIETHIAHLRRYARALLGNSADADDLVQESLVRALARPRFWQHVREPRAYLFAILHNAYVDRLASRRRAGGEPVQLDLVRARLGRPAPQPAAIELRDLDRALAALSPEQREAVLLVGLEGMTYQQVADIVHVPLGTVMSRLARGRESLRRMMEGEGCEGKPVIADGAQEPRLARRAR